MAHTVEIEYDVLAKGLRVYVYDDSYQPGGPIVVARVAEGGHLEFEPYEDGYDIPPTFVLTDPIARSLADQLAEQGFKTPREETMRGTLDAQSDHLEDLRRLLGLSDDVEAVVREVKHGPRIEE